jgi:SNF2 family DNA or RNA helicase
MVSPFKFDSQERFVNQYVGLGGSAKEVEKLHESLRPMFLRRKKSDVQKDLPPINRVIRFHTLSPRAEALYAKVLEGIYVALEHYDPQGIGGDERNVMSILSQIGRLKQICAADKVDYTADLAQDISDETGKRILIFSQYKGTALSIAQRLGGEAVCTVERRPDSFDSLNAEKRDELFESVRGDPRVKYIVTTTAAQEGHNLEFCSVTLFNDPFWTPEAHRQCEGRSYGRLSDPHPIDSYYIVADVDIERWIMELLDKKLGIIEEAVDGVENSREVFGSVAKELIRLMKDAQLRQAAKKGGFVL